MNYMLARACQHDYRPSTVHNPFAPLQRTYDFPVKITVMSLLKMQFRVRGVLAAWAALVAIFQATRTCASSCNVPNNLVDNELLDLQQSTSCTLNNIKTVDSTDPITVKSINSASFAQYELISHADNRHFKVPSSKILLLENVELKEVFLLLFYLILLYMNKGFWKVFSKELK